MKAKNILLALIIFLMTPLFVSAQCASLGGVCTPSVACSTTSVPSPDCGSGVCCGGTATTGSCASLGGTCTPAAFCSASTIPASDCGSGVCCGGTAPTTTTTTTAAGATTFSNPLSVNSIIDLFNSILTSLRSWIAVVAIIFIVIGGLMYMMSAGDEKMITRAKGTITGAIIGLAIALASPTFLKELLCILNATGASCPTVVMGGTSQDLVNNALTVQQIALNVLRFLLSVVGVIGIIGLVVGGTFYLTAYGDEKRIDKGKSIITYSIIGIVVALAALLIVRQVMTLLS